LYALCGAKIAGAFQALLRPETCPRPTGVRSENKHTGQRRAGNVVRERFWLGREEFGKTKRELVSSLMSQKRRTSIKVRVDE